MKKCVTLFCLLLLTVLAHAQWSNTTNQFYDSLHMNVSATTGDQKQPIVVKSYPDSGYFVIWLDYRDQTANGSDIYAQKFDKAGKALWTANGVPVVAGEGYQTFAPPSNADYRYYNYACTDSAGGFYIACDDDNAGVRSTIAHRVTVQHMQSNGSAVFPFPGYVVASPAADLSYQYADPQLIADGNKGFFVGYIKFGSYNDMYVQCFRDEGGTMVNYGGGQMDVNGMNVQVQKACGLGNNINDLDARVTGFSIYPDLQGGCGVLMTMDQNAGGNERVFTGYNKLCRVKKESHVTVFKRSSDIAVANYESYTYKKDSVVRLYNYHTYSNSVSCKDITGNILYVYTDYYVENGGNGYFNLSGLVYNTEYAKGVMIPTDGNVNINLIATSQRNLNADNSTVGYWFKRLYRFPDEVYDSIPYQLATDSTEPYFAYRTAPEGKALDKLNDGSDTILAQSESEYDFALAASANRIFASGMMYTLNPLSTRDCKLQQLQVDRESPDSFAIHYQTAGKSGLTIGSEAADATFGFSIQYDNPFITTDLLGNALFSINQKSYGVRVSPIGDSAKLLWGPMGKLIGTGTFEGHYYYPVNPYIAMSPNDGTAVVAWDDGRNNNSFITDYEDILMRHLDSLDTYDYVPPIRALTTLSYAGSALSPGVLYGTTGKWAEFDGFNGTTFESTPVLSLSDNYNLGAVTGGAYDYLQTPTRTTTTDGKPYLSRDWTIVPEHNPAGAADIGVRLYFTTGQFVQLQAADATITSPGDLIVVKQPATGTNAPDTYTPASTDVLIVPTAWQPVEGGYYVELPVNSFSQFFIKKNDGILPVTWLSVSASRSANNMATVAWSVANEINIKNYLVQYSEDGTTYKDGCTVNASGRGSYNCAFPASLAKVYYVRVKETDRDGRWSNSSIVWLNKTSGSVRFALSPNPARSEATLSYTVPSSATATLTLSNGAGVVLWQQRQSWGTSGTVNIPVRSLPAGIYYLRIATGSSMQTLQLEKSLE